MMEGDRAFLYKGTPIYFTSQGKGPAVVFLHGFLESREIWNDFIALLPQSYRYITIDLPGHGKTGNLSYVHTMDEMADAVYYVLKKLKLKKAILIGHSMGGYVSLAIAEKHPDFLDGLCLFHSTARADSLPKKKDRERSIAIVKQHPHKFIQEIIPKLFYKIDTPAIQEKVEMLKNIASRMTIQGMVAALEGMKIRPEREIIIRFAPYRVGFIIGKNDAVLPYEDIIEQTRLPENSDFIVVEECGHMGFFEQPHICANFIRHWLRKIIKYRSTKRHFS
ncbi:MAG: alpha/beta hydrolase [Vicingaceae bacterium]|nr:MAG: alpha/beta hydrolase [Vicingaceae bacterium]